MPYRILEMMSALNTVSISFFVLFFNFISRMTYSSERSVAMSFLLCMRKLQSCWKVIPRMLTDVTVWKSVVTLHEQEGRLLRQKRICFVFSELIRRLFFVDQFWTRVISSCKICSSVADGCFTQGAMSVLSSEYLIIVQFLLAALRSSVNMLKMFGPPTVPCEQPVCMGNCGY